MITSLAALCAAAIIAAFTVWLQLRSWKHQASVKARDKAREAAISVVAELSALVGKRLYRQKRFLWAIRRTGKFRADESGICNPDPQIESDIAEYRKTLFEWNDRLGDIQVRLECSFDREVMLRLEQDLHQPLAQAHNLIESCRLDNRDEIAKRRSCEKQLNNCEVRLNKLTGRANQFIEDLLERTRCMNIEGYERHLDITLSNRENLSIWFLFLRLLGLADKP